MRPAAPTELLVLRHGKAGDAARDHDRPLAPRGEQEAALVGRWLVQRELLPDLVLSSTARRAAETARCVIAELGAHAPRLVTEERLYLAGVTTLAGVLGEQAGEARRVLLVGHNPGLAELVEALTGQPIEADPVSGTVFPTAALARLELQHPWGRLGPGCARCLAMVRGRGLAPDEQP